MTKFITHIQLRAARHALNLGVRDMAKILKVSKATISKAELGKTRDFLYKHSAALIEFFNSHNINFPNEYIIRYQPRHDAKELQQEDSLLTRFQLKTARYVLNINQQELATLIHINKGVINRGEQLPNEEYIKIKDPYIVYKLKTFFQQHGILFPDHFSIFFKKHIDNNINK